VAKSLDDRRRFWWVRETISEVQKFEGGSIKHDVSVPLVHIQEFLVDATAAELVLIPGCRPVPFGHLGDGNIHISVNQPVGSDKDAFLARWHDMSDVVFAVVKK
jgi:FAD/FMN-containing dehydrogenase